MKKERFLAEQQRNRLLENSGLNVVENAHLISIDIQPEYESGFGFNIHQFTNFLNENYDRLNSLTFLYNGADTLGMVSEEDYKMWLFENGLEENILLNSSYSDKGYAYFRYCMDENVHEDEIIDLIKYMIDKNINDSRDIDEEMWNGFMRTYNYDMSEIRDLLETADDMIYIPDLMDFLKKYSGKIVMCGGGIDECFKEVEIAMNVLNKNYNILTKFTY